MKRPDKPGRIVFRIAQKTGNDSEWSVRAVSSDILGDKDTVVASNRDEIIRNIRVIYSIIENRAKQSELCNVDEVADDFRVALKGDARMRTVIDKAEQDFPLRADLVSVGNEYKRDFRFVYPDGKKKYEYLLEFIDIMSKQAKNDGKQSRARSFRSTHVSLSKFLYNSDIDIKTIDKSFIIRYSSWLKETGVTDSTQSFYLRTLRSILNRAKNDGLIDAPEDLFSGLNTRVIFSNPIAYRETLSRDIINRISSINLVDNHEAEIVRDMFMFGFYCRGMELVDVLNLTKKNIHGDMLVYNRRGKGHQRTIQLDKPAKDIVDKYWWSINQYLFPLKETYMGQKQYSITDRVRRHIKEIGGAVGYSNLKFSMNISTWQHLISQVSTSEILLKSV